MGPQSTQALRSARRLRAFECCCAALLSEQTAHIQPSSCSSWPTFCTNRRLTLASRSFERCENQMVASERKRAAPQLNLTQLAQLIASEPLKSSKISFRVAGAKIRNLSGWRLVRHEQFNWISAGREKEKEKMFAGVHAE